RAVRRSLTAAADPPRSVPDGGAVRAPAARAARRRPLPSARREAARRDRQAAVRRPRPRELRVAGYLPSGRPASDRAPADVPASCVALSEPWDGRDERIVEYISSTRWPKRFSTSARFTFNV